MAIIDSLGFAVDTSDLKKAQIELKKTGDSASSAAEKSKSSMSKLRGSFGKVSSSVISLKGAIGALGVSLAFREVLQANQAWTQQTNALKLVTNSAAELAKVQNDLFDIAQRTRSSTEGTVDLYARLARSTKELGISQERLANVTETVNKAIAASGATGASADAALFQLGQGLASGALRGDELNSVMEQTPRLAQALADGIGVSVGQLRKLGEQGKLTSEVVIAAFENQSSVIDKEFGKTNKTVSQALTQISNELTKTLGQVDDQGLIDALDSLRETIADPVVVKGLQNIAQGLFFIVENATKAAAAVGSLLSDIGEGIGEFAGSVVSGVYLVDEHITKAATATEQLAQKREALKVYEDQIASLSKQMQTFGSSVPKETIDVFNKTIQEAAVEAGKLRAQIEVLETRAAKEPKAAAPEEEAASPKPVIDTTDTKLQDQLQKRFEMLQKSYMNEQELALQAFYDRNALIDELEQNRIGTEDERMALRLDSHAQYESEITAITEEETKKRQQIEQNVNRAIQANYISSAQSIASIIKDLGGKSKAAAIAALLVEKGAAVASVIANAEAAKFQVMGTTPPYAWPSLIASIEANRALSIGAIAASTIAGLSGGGGGGTSSGSVGGGNISQPSTAAPSPSVAPVEQQALRQVNVNVQGGLHSDSDVRTLIERLNEVGTDLGSNTKLVVTA